MNFIVYQIIALVSLGYMAIDIFLPSIVPISKYFNTDVNTAQLTISIYLLGFSLTNLIYGVLSDSYGRKKPLVIGLIITLIGSIICSISESISILIFGRFIQACGTGAMSPICRSILIDKCNQRQLAKYSSILGVSTASMLAIAPFIGGCIQAYIGWQYNFICIVMCTSILLITTIVYLPETSENLSNKILSLKNYSKNLKILYTNKNYVIFTICGCLPMSSYAAWLTTGPVLIQKNLKFTPDEFGIISLFTGIAYAMGCIVNIKRLNYTSLIALLKLGGILMLLSSFILFLFAILDILNVYSLVIPMFFNSLGASFVLSNAFGLALNNINKIAGLGSSIYSFFQIFASFIASSIMQVSSENNQIPMATLILLSSFFVVILSYFNDINKNN